MSEYLYLDHGTIKRWNVGGNGRAMAAIHAYASEGSKMRQKRAICRLIQAIGGPIIDEWTGEEMTKPDANRYVMEYRP